MPAESVEQYIGALTNWEEELEQLRKLMLSTEMEETIKWGVPVYTVNGKNVVGIAAFKNHIALWFYQGALLKNDTSLLVTPQGEKTKAMRQIRFEKGQNLPMSQIRAYVMEAIQNQKEGKEIKPERNISIDVPTQLSAAFNEDQDLKSSFGKLTSGRQREYCEYIKEAKRESTKEKRLQKVIPMIKTGKGLNDQYRK